MVKNIVKTTATTTKILFQKEVNPEKFGIKVFHISYINILKEVRSKFDYKYIFIDKTNLKQVPDWEKIFFVTIWQLRNV